MKTVLLLSNHHLYTYNLRKEVIQAFIDAKYRVIATLPYGEKVELLKKMGCEYIDAPLDRRGKNPLKDLKLFFTYCKILRRVKPDVVLLYTIKPNVYGGIACRINKIPYLANITGLGTSFENQGLIQKMILGLYRVSFKKAACVFFQNEPNRLFFVNKNIVRKKARLIPGSGVNLEQNQFENYPAEDGTIRFLFIGRIMKSKGVDELFEAAKIVKKQYPNVQFDLIGGMEENYSDRLDELGKSGIIKYHGQQDDVHSFIKNAHATILPSYHEGTANVLLESASAGRPVLASNVTGCIETFDEGISGFGFEVRDVDSLVQTIVKFIELPYEKKAVMGAAGREKMKRDFDRNIVVRAYMDEVNEIFGSK